MEQAVGPASAGVWRQFVDDTHALATASRGHTIKSACSVEDYPTPLGIRSIAAAGETVKHAFGPASVGVLRQLENGAVSRCTACRSRAVKVSGGVEDEALI